MQAPRQYQPDLIHVATETVGTRVSARCRFVDDREGGVRAVFVDGVNAFRYRLSDRLARMSVWVEVCLQGFATQKEVAEANEFSLRSLHYWVDRHREHGLAGLVDRPKSGAPKKLTDKVRRRIYALRDDGCKRSEIASALHISLRLVGQALQERENARAASAPELPFGEDARDGVGNSSPACGEPAPEPADEPAFDAPQAACGASCDPSPAVPAPASPAPLPDAVEDSLSRDRGPDRALAALGRLQDAPPLFRTCGSVRYAGAFLAVAYLAEDPYLECATKLYGQFGAAFYGTRTIFLSLLLMLLLRCSRVEHLKELCPQELGFVLGLDRSPEPRTLRRRLACLAGSNLGAELMGEMAAGRCAGYLGVVNVDDHVEVYHGKRKIGKVFSNRTKRAAKGRTEQWAHDDAGRALFVLESEFNETLVAMMPKVVEQLRAALGVDTLDLTFDRAGSYGAFLKALKESPHCEFTVYRRRPYADLPEGVLVPEETRIGNSTYASRPYDHDVTVNVYAEVENGDGGKRRKVVGTVTLREIRLLRPDGKQVALLTSHDRGSVSAEDVVLRPQGRWGNQENALKYARQNFDLDGLWTYRTEPVTDSRLDHPHPQAGELKKQLASARKERDRIYRRCGKALLDGSGDAGRTARAERSAADRKEELARIDEKVEALAAALAGLPERETAQQGEFRTLCTKTRLLQNAIVLSADAVERGLAALLQDDFARSDDEGRALVAAALKTSGSVTLAPGKLLVQLAPQSSPHRTRAVNALCAKLNDLNARYPGSARVLEFLPTPTDPAPAPRR